MVLNEISNPSVSGKPEELLMLPIMTEMLIQLLHLEILAIISVKISVVVIGLLNINSFAGKFDLFKTIISGKVDVMIIVETKLDNSYPTSPFYMHGYSKPFRGDTNKYGGGILIYIKEDIPSKILDITICLMI